MYYLIDVVLFLAIPLICKGQDVVLTNTSSCYNINDDLTLEAEYKGSTNVDGVKWTITGGASTMTIAVSTCSSPLPIPSGFPSGRMTHDCSSAPKYRLTVQTLESADFNKSWGVDFSLLTGTTSSGVQQQTVVQCESVYDDDDDLSSREIAGIAIGSLVGCMFLVVFILIVKYHFKKDRDYYISIITETTGECEPPHKIDLAFDYKRKPKTRCLHGIFGKNMTEVFKGDCPCDIRKLTDISITYAYNNENLGGNPECRRVIMYSAAKNFLKTFIYNSKILSNEDSLQQIRLIPEAEHESNQDYYIRIITGESGVYEPPDKIGLTFSNDGKDETCHLYRIFGENKAEVFKCKCPCDICQITDILIVYEYNKAIPGGILTCEKVIIYSAVKKFAKTYSMVKNDDIPKTHTNSTILGNDDSLQKRHIRFKLEADDESNYENIQLSCSTLSTKKQRTVKPVLSSQLGNEAIMDFYDNVLLKADKPCCIKVTRTDRNYIARTATSGTPIDVYIRFHCGKKPNEMVLLHGIKLNIYSEQTFFLPLFPGGKNDFDTFEIGIVGTDRNMSGWSFQQVHFESSNSEKHEFEDKTHPGNTLHRTGALERIQRFTSKNTFCLKKNTTLKMRFKCNERKQETVATGTS